MWRAVNKFPDLTSCQDENNPNKQTVDWKLLRSYSITNICLFYLFETMSGPEDVTAYLKAEGFRKITLSQGSARSVSGDEFGYQLDDHTTLITAIVRRSDSLKKFAGRKFDWLEKGQTLHVIYFSDNKLAEVQAMHMSALN